MASNKTKNKVEYDISALNGDIGKVTEILTKFAENFGDIYGEVSADKKKLVIVFYKPATKCCPPPNKVNYASAHAYMHN